MFMSESPFRSWRFLAAPAAKINGPAAEGARPRVPETAGRRPSVLIALARSLRKWPTEQIRTAFAGELFRLLALPARDGGMIAGEEHGRDLAAFPDARPGIVRMLEQALLEAL